MRTQSTKGRSDDQEFDGRDLELENIIGNLMIAQYQVDKLRSRLSERIGGYGSASNKKGSTHVFKHNDKWYRVNIGCNEQTAAPIESLSNSEAEAIETNNKLQLEIKRLNDIRDRNEEKISDLQAEASDLRDQKDQLTRELKDLRRKYGDD